MPYKLPHQPLARNNPTPSKSLTRNKISIKSKRITSLETTVQVTAKNHGAEAECEQGRSKECAGERDRFEERKSSQRQPTRHGNEIASDRS